MFIDVLQETYSDYRDHVRQRRIVRAIARRGTLHGTGLGNCSGVVERSFAWLHGFERLRIRIRWKRRADIHEAFLEPACCLPTDQLILLAAVRAVP